MPWTPITFERVKEIFKGKSVAIVGSGPGCLDNSPGFIDSQDIVVRINNFRLSGNTGFRTDVFYSFFGNSIRTKKEDLKDTYLCMCKCPNGFIESRWHKRNKQKGSDWRYIYENRKDWFFCETYIPEMEKFNRYFSLLDNHIPTTGFSCILDLNDCDCDIYLTGFDFFTSQIHNVNERWKPGREDDPIGHRPELERNWLKENKNRFRLDRRLSALLI